MLLHEGIIKADGSQKISQGRESLKLRCNHLEQDLNGDKHEGMKGNQIQEFAEKTNTQLVGN